VIAGIRIREYYVKGVLGSSVGAVIYNMKFLIKQTFKLQVSAAFNFRSIKIDAYGTNPTSGSPKPS
jgi:hypothetical protein